MCAKPGKIIIYKNTAIVYIPSVFEVRNSNFLRGAKNATFDRF